MKISRLFFDVWVPYKSNIYFLTRTLQVNIKINNIIFITPSSGLFRINKYYKLPERLIIM